MSTLLPSLAPAAPLRCLVVDDDPTTLLVLEQCIARTPTLQAVGFCTTPHEALTLLRTHPVEVLFLDVEMPLLSGLDLLELLRQLPQSPHTVLITVSAEYATEAFRYAVVDYLVKPITYPRFLQAVHKVAGLVAASQPAQYLPAAPAAEFMFIKAGNQMVRINFADVCYLEARGGYVHIVLQKQKIIVFGTLRSMKERLPAAGFFTIHRSFVVNIRHIEEVDHSNLLINGKYLPVSSLLRSSLLSKLNVL